MRWRKPQNGDRRTVRKFLIIPRTIGGQTRWFEWATFVQEYHRNAVPQWVDVEWDADTGATWERYGYPKPEPERPPDPPVQDA